MASVKDYNQNDCQNQFIITIEDAQNVKYGILQTFLFVHAVNVSHDQNLTILKTEKHILIETFN